MHPTLAGARRRAPGLALLVAAAVGALALGAAAPRPAAAQGAYKVIVNPATATSSVTKAELAAVYLKKAAKWSDGTLASPVDLPPEAEVRGQFSREVLGRPTEAIRAYWNQMVFAGRNVPPAEKPSDADVVAYVRSTPGAVGYVRADAATPGVKVVTVRS
jgi:ABC-type phosphate transport system substrate-binding protein